jgi:hypothetical protein
VIAQLTIPGCDVEVREPEPTAEERAEIERLNAAHEERRRRRRDELTLSIERTLWRRRAERAAWLRSLSPDERERALAKEAAEDAAFEAAQRAAEAEMDAAEADDAAE